MKCILCGSTEWVTLTTAQLDILAHGMPTVRKGSDVPLCGACNSAQFALSGPEYEARKRGDKYVCAPRD